MRVVEGDGVRIRPWDPADGGDVAALVAASTDARIADGWFGSVSFEAASARQFLRDLRDRDDRGVASSFAIVDTERTTTVGYVACDGFDPDSREGEVSYWLLPDERGRGLACRALALMAPVAVDLLALDNLNGFCGATNVRSIGVLERAGWERAREFEHDEHGRSVHYRYVKPRSPVVYAQRARIDLDELNGLYGRAWGGDGKADYGRVLEHSFTWVVARSDDELVGFVNVAWDGGAHFFLLDTTVHPRHQRRGIGTRLVRDAIDACRAQPGAQWLHVDSSPRLMRTLYSGAGFSPTDAGLAWVGGATNGE